MSALLIAAGAVAAAAGVRGTWSPCGLSMLSTVTPLAEAGRGHRYRWTASWFFAGALLGGATTGAFAAALAALVSSVQLSATATYGAAAVAAVLAAALDGRLIGPPMPHHRRQVDEDWLGRYRAWVYGVGFGWQIGTGLATYVMTAAVYLTIVLAALTGSPVAALVICVLFGGVRGSMVLLGVRLTSAERLTAFHRRFEAWREPVHRGVIVVEACAAVGLAAAGGPPAVAAGIAAATVTAAVRAVRWSRSSDDDRITDACSVPHAPRTVAG